MANQDLVINGKIVIDESAASTPIKSIKAQLKEANAELMRVSETFGETSIEAVNAAKKVAELKDRIGDAKALTDAFNPDKKFQAFSQAINGVVGGFSALQGAQALFGVKSEELEKTLLKVQGAMALSQGLSAVTESIDAFKNLGTVIKQTTAFQILYNSATKMAIAIQTAFGIAVDATSTSFKVLRTAIITTGIGALIVALGYVVNALVDWASSSSKVEEQNKKLTASIDEQNKILEENKKQLARTNELELSRMKAQGASADELFNKKQELIKQERALINLSLQQQYIALQALYDNRKKTEDGIKTYKNALDKYNKAYADFKDLEVQLEINKNEKIADTNAKANEKAKETRKKFEENQKDAQKLQTELKINLLKEEQQELRKLELKYQEDKKTLQKGGIKDFSALNDSYEKDKKVITKKFRDKEAKDEKDFQNKLAEIIYETKLSGIVDVRKKEMLELRNEYAEKRKEIENDEKLNSDRKIELLTALATQENEAIKQLRQTFAQEDLKIKTDKYLAEANNEKISFDKRLIAIKQREDAEKDIIFKSQQDKTAYEDANKEARIKIAEEEKQAKIQLAQDLGSALTALSDVVGKETAVGKGLSVASALMSTYQGIAKGVAQGFPQGIPAIIAASATGFSAVRNILKTKIPNYDTGSGTSANMSTPSVTAPIAPQLATTMMNQTQINQLSSATTRAFVLESDVTSNQERIIRLNRAARIN